MSDTPDKKDTPSSESTESAEKKSPWFVTPMGDKKPEDKQEEKQDKIKFQPKEDKDSVAETPEKSAPSAATPKPSQTASASEANPLAAGSSISFDDDEAESSDVISKPMLAVDCLVAAVAIAFTVLILRDVMPFL